MDMVPSNLQNSATFVCFKPGGHRSRNSLHDIRLFPTSYLRDELRLSWLKPWQEQNLPSILGLLSG